jgi:hypothetical protein
MGGIKNGKSRDNGNIVHTRHMTKTNNNKKTTTKNQTHKQKTQHNTTQSLSHMQNS